MSAGRQAQAELNQLRAHISTSAGQVASGQTVTITGNGFIPGRTPDGTTVLDGFGVFPPLPGQFGATGPPFAAPTSTVPGQTWDEVTVTVTGHHSTVKAPVVTGPDGNGTVKVSIDTTGMAVGTYTVTITGRVLTQTISFQVKNSNFS